jgi:hypothetical protein
MWTHWTRKVPPPRSSGPPRASTRKMIPFSAAPSSLLTSLVGRVLRTDAKAAKRARTCIPTWGDTSLKFGNDDCSRGMTQSLRSIPARKVLSPSRARGPSCSTPGFPRGGGGGRGRTMEKERGCSSCGSIFSSSRAAPAAAGAALEQAAPPPAAQVAAAPGTYQEASFTPSCSQSFLFSLQHLEVAAGRSYPPPHPKKLQTEGETKHSQIRARSQFQSQTHAHTLPLLL